MEKYTILEHALRDPSLAIISDFSNWDKLRIINECKAALFELRMVP